MNKTFKTFLTSETGASAVEYGLLVALIAAVIIGTVKILGQNVNDGFEKVNTEIGPATQ